MQLRDCEDALGDGWRPDGCLIRSFHRGVAGRVNFDREISFRIS